MRCLKDPLIKIKKRGKVWLGSEGKNLYCEEKVLVVLVEVFFERGNRCLDKVWVHLDS